MREYRIGRLNGRFVVTWNEGAGRKRYRLDAQSRREAEAEALDVIRRETLPKGALTVADVWGAYRDYLGDRPTGRNMAYTGKPVLAHFGALRPDQIDRDHCTAYAETRRDAGRSDGAIHTELGHLRSALVWGFKSRLIARPPFIWRPQKPAPKDRYLTRAEVDRLLSVQMEPHIRLAIILMLTTGGRVGAVLELTWDRVDFTRGQIDLRVDAARPRKGRAVPPMNNLARAALTTAKEAALSDYVVEWAGRQVKSIRRGFGAAVARAGLAGVGQHTLRHTAAVHMVEAGIDISEVAQFLGHSNPSITFSTYGRYSPTHLRKAAAALEFGTLKRVK